MLSKRKVGITLTPMRDQDPYLGYLDAHTTAPEETQYEQFRLTHLRMLAPQMATGPYLGQFLSMISMMIRPQRVLEIGAFTGYGTISLAQGLTPDGRLDTIEVYIEREALIREGIERNGLTEKVNLMIGDAKLIVPTLTGLYDLCLIDAGKRDNIEYYELVKPLLRSGGVILVDNCLWDGKVVNPELRIKSKDAILIHEFNEHVHQDPETINILMPLRDGCMMIMKK